MNDLPQLVPSKTAEKILGLAPNTLRTMRSRRTPNQPPFVRIGGAVRYDLRVLPVWIEQQTVRH